MTVNFPDGRVKMSPGLIKATCRHALKEIQCRQRKQQQLYLRIELEVKTELVVEGLNEQGGAVEVFPRLQTQT